MVSQDPEHELGMPSVPGSSPAIPFPVMFFPGQGDVRKTSHSTDRDGSTLSMLTGGKGARKGAFQVLLLLPSKCCIGQAKLRNVGSKVTCNGRRCTRQCLKALRIKLAWGSDGLMLVLMLVFQ